MVLGEIISKVAGAPGPVDAELALVDAVPGPVKAHVDGFGPDLFDRAIHDSTGGGIVSFHGCGRLWVAHFDEGGTNDGAFFGVHEKGTEFSFGG